MNPKPEDFKFIPSIVEKDDIRVFKELLGEISSGKDSIRILEYGAGYSAIYYPLFMQEQGIKYEWRSIEHDPKWANRINQLAQEYQVNSKVLLCKVALKLLRHCGNNSAKVRYVNHPNIIGRGFDLIYVDGRVRSRCLNACERYLNSGGIIYLDNAERKYYHKTLAQFNGKFIKPHLWKGNLK